MDDAWHDSKTSIPHGLRFPISPRWKVKPHGILGPYFPD